MNFFHDCCSNIGSEREKQVLDGIEAAFAPYVKDRGLDWEINIDQVKAASNFCMHACFPCVSSQRKRGSTVTLKVGALYLIAAHILRCLCTHTNHIQQGFTCSLLCEHASF